jgi:hypothetical protein
MSQPWYVEFWYGDDSQHPHGIIETGIREDYVQAIRDLAAEPANNPRSACDCITVAPHWAHLLSKHGPKVDPLPVRSVGGMGDCHDGIAAPSCGYALTKRPRLIGRHFWVVIGGKEWIFDPTAHQFDSGLCVTEKKPGIHLDRYWCGGRSFAARRLLGPGRCEDC